MNDQTTAAFADVQEAFAQFAAACDQVWDAIVEAFTPIIRAIARLYSQWRALHLIPRQYRVTMARRKIRRYALYCARRA